MAPLYAHYGRNRPVWALDLPGFGLSERRDQRYTPRLMTDALHVAITHLRQTTGAGAVDLLAVSLSCEFAARVACEAPATVRRLALLWVAAIFIVGFVIPSLAGELKKMFG